MCMLKLIALFFQTGFPQVLAFFKKTQCLLPTGLPPWLGGALSASAGGGRQRHFTRGRALRGGLSGPRGGADGGGGRGGAGGAA